MSSLPQPVTAADEYLAAIYGVLGEIRDRLPKAASERTDGAVSVSEPARVQAKKQQPRRRS